MIAIKHGVVKWSCLVNAGITHSLDDQYSIIVEKQNCSSYICTSISNKTTLEELARDSE